ncbi:MAG: hypothetical protein ACRD3G_10085 [Vicinamibacterales bacterium]
MAAERSISRCHARSRERTRSVVPSSSTSVAPATAAPTAVRQAKPTFSFVSGALRTIAARAAGTIV